MKSHEIDYKIIGDDIQSMPIPKLISALSPYGRNRGKEDNSILGNFLQR